MSQITENELEEKLKELAKAMLRLIELQTEFVKKHLCQIKNEDFRTDIFWFIFIGGKEIDADSKKYKQIKEWINQICSNQ